MDPILEVEEEEESASPYSPPMVTLMAQESEQMTLANILREMEMSRRETFDQLRADRRQSEIFLQEHIQRLELREDERRRNTSYNEYYSRTWKGKERKGEKPPSKDHPPRTNSSRTSHESANSSQSSRTSSIKCFKCLGYGHIASNCPTKRNMILNPKGEVESEHSSPPPLKVLPPTLLPNLQVRMKSNLMKEVCWWLGAC